MRTLLLLFTLLCVPAVAQIPPADTLTGVSLRVWELPPSGRIKMHVEIETVFDAAMVDVSARMAQYIIDKEATGSVFIDPPVLSSASGLSSITFTMEFSVTGEENRVITVYLDGAEYEDTQDHISWAQYWHNAYGEHFYLFPPPGWSYLGKSGLVFNA